MLSSTGRSKIDIVQLRVLTARDERYVTLAQNADLPAAEANAHATESSAQSTFSGPCMARASLSMRLHHIEGCEGGSHWRRSLPRRLLPRGPA
eukprot:3871710-Prymnesium_polylepis.1